MIGYEVLRSSINSSRLSSADSRTWATHISVPKNQIPNRVSGTKGGDGLYSVEKTKIKAHCKLKALDLVGRLNGSLGKTKIEFTGALGVAHLSTEEYKQARKDMIKEDNC